MFDNTDYETRLPHQWVAGGDAEAGEEAKPSPARILVESADGSISWESCSVLSYDHSSGRYTVDCDGETQETSRIRLYFLAEDPVLFSKRFASAVL